MARDVNTGANDRLARGSLPFSSLANFTFAFWMWLDAGTSVEDRPLRYGEGASSVCCGYQSGGTTMGWVDEGIAWRGNFATTNTGQWHFILAYRSASGNVFFEQNGAAVANFGIAPNTPVNNVRWGGTEGSESIDGAIGPLAIWDVALGAGERAALAKGASPLMVRPSGLKTYVPVWGGTTTEGDLAVGSIAWSVTGTMARRDHPGCMPPVLF